MERRDVRIPSQKLAPGDVLCLVDADTRVVGLHGVQRTRSRQANFASGRRKGGAWHIETIDGDKLVKGQAIRCSN